MRPAQRNTRAGCGEDRATAFRDVAVVDVRSGDVRRGQTVIVQGTRITAVAASAQTRIPVGARINEGAHSIPLKAAAAARRRVYDEQDAGNHQ